MARRSWCATRSCCRTSAPGARLPVLVAAAHKTSAAPLPAKLAGLLREAKWLALAALAAYLVLVLATFHKGDPAFSATSTGGVTQNAGGAFGAGVADALLSVFGFSAYWWVVLCVVFVIRSYRRLEPVLVRPGKGAPVDEAGRKPLWIALGGFLLLLVASSALESLRLNSVGSGLPQVSGGILGHLVAGFA
ncbi:MAG: hypothetical protein FJY43_06695, partial [Betaproteobacteria bacterium]|nr:hypothetical protein [Betaproteobacteria bacterium]